MQQLIIIGNVAKAAEVRQVNENVQVISFRVAVNESYKDKQGQKQERTTYYKVERWVKAGASTKVAEFLTKGKLVSVTGKPSVSAYLDKDNQAQADLVVRVNNAPDALQLLGSNGQGTSGNEATHNQVVPAGGDDDNDLPF